ncbi:flavin reductase [Rhodoligotrophos appendicifer]|uniref:flavin reductase family protein n=1 Tax=Rhodoligotrophos appendicifer TaxID=987056 RepID=UPI001186A2B4|nr:flavin reductase family protein [Rhodoligotrophos appendicifer]
MSMNVYAVHDRDGMAGDFMQPLPSVDRNAFVEAMSGAVTGVTVVTTDGPAGQFGLTVSAVASVSADPPMVLTCVNRRSPAAAAINDNGVFCVNMLAQHHWELSNTFAGRPAEGEPFDFSCADWHRTPTGSSRLPDAVASFDCEVFMARDAGSHIIFVGRVVDATAADHAPLAHSRRAYCTTSQIPTDR